MRLINSRNQSQHKHTADNYNINFAGKTINKNSLTINKKEK